MIANSIEMGRSPGKLEGGLGKFNLFADQFAAKQPVRVRRGNTQKAEIKIVFEHPNLLYLSEKREKTREEISRQAQEKIMNSIKRKKYYCNLRTGVRPCTSDIHATSFGGFRNENLAMRCRTSKQSRRMAMKRELQVMGSSSSCFNELNDNFAGFQEVNSSGKGKDGQGCVLKVGKQNKIGRFDAKLNMYLEIQRKAFKYRSGRIESKGWDDGKRKVLRTVIS